MFLDIFGWPRAVYFDFGTLYFRFNSTYWPFGPFVCSVVVFGPSRPIVYSVLSYFVCISFVSSDRHLVGFFCGYPRVWAWGVISPPVAAVFSFRIWDIKENRNSYFNGIFIDWLGLVKTLRWWRERVPEFKT